MYTEGSPYLELTPLSEYEQHLLELWFECGTVGQGAGGITPLDWTEILAWANQFYSEHYVEWVEHPRHSNRHKRVYTPLVINQCTLLDSELQMIRKLSQEYTAEYSLASEPNRECPKQIVIEDISEDDALANANAMAEGFKNLFGQPQDRSVEMVQNK
ncbi:MAG: hypothetical protein ACXW1D_00705 [Halobacteriota archaeon]